MFDNNKYKRQNRKPNYQKVKVRVIKPTSELDMINRDKGTIYKGDSGEYYTYSDVNKEFIEKLIDVNNGELA